MKYQAILAVAGGLAGLISPTGIHAQTPVDLRSRAKSVDFSSAASTMPFESGASVLATCQAGEVFFKTGEAAGNIHFCSSRDKWMQLVASVSSSSSVPSDGCSPGTLYMLSDSEHEIHQLYVCSASGTWSISSILSGPAAGRPANCVAGQLYFSTDLVALAGFTARRRATRGLGVPPLPGLQGRRAFQDHKGR
jgi:hypothetical protein